MLLVLAALQFSMALAACCIHLLAVNEVDDQGEHRSYLSATCEGHKLELMMKRIHREGVVAIQAQAHAHHVAYAGE